MEEMCFRRFLKKVKDSAARIELGRAFHEEGTVCGCDFVPLWHGTTMRYWYYNAIWYNNIISVNYMFLL